ncbi:MAG: hypothetical protein H5T86_07460 [Armatimonadetes bacterium]|nr:hypothetical protein [Armatimonadota bacterium]
MFAQTPGYRYGIFGTVAQAQPVEAHLAGLFVLLMVFWEPLAAIRGVASGVRRKGNWRWEIHPRPRVAIGCHAARGFRALGRIGKAERDGPLRVVASVARTAANVFWCVLFSRTDPDRRGYVRLEGVRQQKEKALLKDPERTQHPLPAGRIGIH